MDAMPVIDLQNKVGVLELCGTCTFTLAYVSIANENRAGTGGGISAFRGLPGSRVEWVGGVGLRPACPSTASALSLLAITQRSSLFPGKQVVSSTNFTYRVSWVVWLQHAGRVLSLADACMQTVQPTMLLLLSSRPIFHRAASTGTCWLSLTSAPTSFLSK